MFPENAKVASVTPIDKKTDDKNSVLNFCPISVLNCFSKVYENILKTQLVEKMSNLFSPFISAYRESYSTLNVLIRLIEEWRKNLDNNYFIGAVLMDLSQAFDYIPHDLVIAKLAAYGFDKKMICYIYSYLKSRKQCVSVNKINSTFEEIILGVPQGSVVGPVLFNIFFNNFFCFILVASAHNFADDNTLSSFAKTIEILISILELGNEIAINWFKDNHMIVNQDKFQAIMIDKHKGNHTNQVVNIDQKEIKAVSKVKLLVIKIDDKLNFNHHINNICKSASNQLNALIRLKHLLGFEERKGLANILVMSNFNYCSPVRNFSSAQSLHKIKNLQKRALRNLLNDYYNTYQDLLEKSSYPNMNLRTKRTLCSEIYKTLNKLNPGYMNDIFKLRNTDRLTREKYKLNLEIPKPNQATFGTRSLRSYGPKTWNALPYHIKSSDNLNSFKAIIKWIGNHCTCRVCEHATSRP